MELKEVVQVLEDYAPQKLAAEWDNVGLLLEPSKHVVNKIMLTNDLTLKVLDEAISSKTDMLVSYHPPIFKALKKLGQGAWKEKVVVGCLENRIALYSPHTAWDCVKGGVNDWLIQPFEGKVKVLQPLPVRELYKIEVDSSKVDKVGDWRKGQVEGIISDIKWKQGPGGKLATMCSDKEAQMIYDVIGGNDTDTKLICQQLVTFPDKSTGYGRLVTLDEPISIKEIIHKLKGHLGLDHLQLALAHDATEDTEVKKIAACAGSGSSLLQGVPAELYITGEMSHHEILDCTNSAGGSPASVVLCNHSNSERGFLASVMKGYLESKLGGKVEVVVSEQDRDPLQTV